MNFKLALGLCLVGMALLSMVRAGDQVESFGGVKLRSAAHNSEGEETEEQSGGQSQQDRKDALSLMNEYAKIMLNPVALVRKISREFNVPKGKLIEKLGKGLVFGTEAVLSPVIACVKIVEKVFEYDACRLKFMCDFGARLDFMKETMLKFSPNFIETSSHLKALSYGIIGRDCVQTYTDCEPTLKEPFKELLSEEDRKQADRN